MEANSKPKIRNWAYMLFLEIMLVISIILVKIFMSYSFSADSTTVTVETNLEKYINYAVSDNDSGTLIQYQLRMKVDTGAQEEAVPLKSSQLVINVNQIDDKYPYDVKVITKSTELTNGKTENFLESYEYDSNTGTINIKTSNQDENGELISNIKPSSDARDEYVIIAHYDTYIEEPEERELDVKVKSNVILSDDDRQINQENEIKAIVQDNIGELTSVTRETKEIYNGYIKSNIINETNYDTQYNEMLEITVSKKEAQQKIKFKENNFFEKVNKDLNGEDITQEFESNGNLIYKSTTIKQEDMKKLLGENGVIEILDSNENLLATINGNTEFQKDGKIVITYENEPESIIIKTSNIENEGILYIENTKAIKSIMQNMDYNKIKTAIEITGIKEESIITEIKSEETGKIKKTEETIEKQAYINNYENTTEIKESTNNIDIDISNTQWTNQYQNDVTFNVYMNANSIKDNMLKNPSIKIELPSEVEKVILGEASVVYANGLELQNPYIETNENGNIVIVANLVGIQTNYNQNTLGLVTDVRISATVILKKDIENSTGNVKLTYTNQYNVNGKTEIENRSSDIKITSYQEERLVENNAEISNYANTSLLGSTVENIEGLTVEVIPVKGDTILKEGDTVYEGEYIKYNIKVTNTSDKQIDNIRVVGSIPEGTVYGELEADYDTAFGKYEYNFDDTIKEKIIEIGSLEAGESSTQFYETKVKDLEEEEGSKNITTTIKTYVGNTVVTNYEISNVINSAQVQMFLASRKNVTEGMWTYALKVNSEIEGVAELKVQLPKEFVLRGITNADGNENGENYEVYDIQLSNDNVMTTKINLTTEEKEYIIVGNIDSLKSDNQTEESKLYLRAIAKVFVNSTVYESNENRIEYKYENVLISMTSDNEGEEVKYQDEIEYKIEVKSIGEKDSYNQYGNVTTVNLKDYLPSNVDPISVTYQNWEIESITQNEETGDYTINGGYKEVEKTEEINGRATDEEGNRLPDIDIDLFIPFYESSTITIKCKAGLVEEKTKIENNATISGDYIFSKTSNTITHTILPYDYEESEDSDNPINPDDPINPDNPGDNNEKYSISGVAWLDENEDGKRQTSEKLLNGITVMLVNTDNSSAIREKQATNSNGEYHFSELEEGNYIVVFNYDTDIYSVTEYQKSGVSNSLNSDAISKEITLMGVKTKVGLTDTISLNASVSNVDIGLIENKICDLKLDKYISKVQVKTASGTKEYAYDNSQLAKIEIKSKEIQGAMVVVTYKIVVTNEGELPAYVTKVLDYIPDGLNFSSDLNKSWTITQRGELANISIANQSIGVGESVELTLVLTKTMTSNSTGTFTNIAEIGEMTNSLGTRDTDSITGNKVENEDDYSKAELIISVSTGAVIYISIILGIALVIAIVIYLNVKFGIKKIIKISLFSTVLISVVFLQNETVLGYSPWSDLPKSASWDETGVHNVNGNGYSAFTASGHGITGYCAMETFSSATGSGLERHLDGCGKYDIKTYSADPAKSDEDISFQKVNKDEDVYIVKEGSKLKIGPFQIKGNATSYTYEITGQKNKYSSPEVTDRTTKNGVTTFYLKINYTEDSIKSVKVTGYKKVTTTSKKLYKAAYAYYIPYSNAGTGTRTWKCEMGHTHTDWPITSYYNNYPYQDVMTNDRYMWTEGGETETQTKHIDLNWIIKYGDLEITKQDTDDSNVKLKDVEIRVQCNTVNYDKTFKTDEYGKISLRNLKQGTYSITEISNSNYGYNIMSSGTVKVKGGMTNTYTLNNTKQTGNLQIVKRDTDSNKTLGGISFKIKISADINQDGIINVDDATQLKKYIENKSEKLKPYGFGDLNKDGVINDDDVRVIQEDLSGTGSYIVVSDSNDEYKGKEVTGTISLTNMKITKNADEATTFITNNDGEINILNMLTGYYCLEETSVGNNFGYADPSDTQDCLDGFEKYINYEYTVIDENGNEKKITESGNNIPFNITKQSSIDTGVDSNFSNIKYSNKLNVYNKKKYIKLSGYVWEDIRDPSKSDERDNIWDTSEGLDQRVNNVLVTLYNKEGTEIDYRTTGGGDLNSDGSYIFGDYINDNNVKKIKIEELDGVYIEFKYNGMSYESVATSLVSNGSKATDKNLRDAFNKKYMSIENDKAIGTDKERVLKYEKHETISTLTYGDGAIKGYHNQKFPISGVTEDNYSITASTSDAYPELLLGQELTINEILKKGEDEISNINLGLYEREQPDISLKKDLQNVRVSINGYDHIYNYNSYYINMIDKEKTNDSETGVEWGYEDLRNKGDVSYTRAIYKSDYLWKNPDDTNKELKVYVTYELKIINESNNLYTMVNSIVDYYDNRYNIVSIGTELSNNKESTKGDIAFLNKDKKLVDKYGKEITIEEYNDNYNKVIINNRTQVEPLSTKNLNNPNSNHESIYVQFELTREAVAEIIHIKGEESKGELLENVAEINSYSTFSDNKFSEIYAGIDEDSNPGNCNPEDKDNYEDDTFACPALKLEEGEERSISGIVFLDESVFDEKNCFHESKESTDTHTGEERNGNGEFNEGESTISGVKVKLYKENQINNNDDGTIKITGSPVVETTYKDGQNEATGGNGEFEISGFIPDKYIIVYTWGDETYISGDKNKPINVEEYKGTIYKEGDRQKNEAWYNKDTNKRYSDAMDDYELRENIDKNDNNITTMNSKTPTMNFAIELDDVISDEKKSSQEFDEEKKVLTFKVPNVDFGITERARQEIAIDKRINSVKLTLANGQVILHAEYEEATKQLVLKTGTAQIIKHRDENNVNRTNGQLWESLDNELIQGSTLEVTYKIVVNNNSEKDYDNKEYYLYGPGHENEEKIVMQQPTGVYDYLDKTMSFEAEKQDDTSMNIVKINSTEESYEKKVKHNLLEGYLKQYEYSEDNDGVLKNIKGYEYYSDEWKNIIEKYWESSTTITEQLAQSVLNEKTIIEISKLESEMSPGEENNVLLKTSKQLTSTDEIVLDNEVEIVDAKRTTDTGRRITVTSSEVYSKGETVVITPPTGDDQNYLPYIILGITSCIILGAGVVIIKKKALK